MEQIILDNIYFPRRQQKPSGKTGTIRMLPVIIMDFGKMPGYQNMGTGFAGFRRPSVRTAQVQRCGLCIFPDAAASKGKITTQTTKLPFLIANSYALYDVVQVNSSLTVHKPPAKLLIALLSRQGITTAVLMGKVTRLEYMLQPLQVMRPWLVIVQ